MKHLLTVLFCAVSVGLLALPAAAHDVKDPVCRMTVDSDTAKFKQKLGNKSFYFCSKECLARFQKDPAKYEKLADQLEKQDLHEYQVDFKTLEPAVAGKPVQMELAVRYQDSKQLVKDFEIVHERLIHLIMTTEDMAWFEHQHPVRGDDGIFRLTWTFPRPGKYRLWADFTPADGDNQVLPIGLTVGGGTPVSHPLTPDTKRVKQIGDLRVELRIQGEPLRMEKPALFTYVVKDAQGRPVRDLQPFIGAMGHLLAISQDGKEVVHTHVLQSASHPAMGGQKEPFRVTPAMVTPTGPALSFKLTVSQGGIYKTWAQFQRRNRVYTVPFTFYVQDLWGKSGAPGKKAGVQRATVTVDGAYSPQSLSFQAGKPVELSFVLKEKSGCGDVVQFPSLAIKKELKRGKPTVVTFTPKKAGAIPFTCRMGMYKGRVIVKE
jgi:YHS domain-containing protein